MLMDADFCGIYECIFMQCADGAQNAHSFA